MGAVDDTEWKIALKPSGTTLIGEDEGMTISLSYDSVEKCYYFSHTVQQSTFNGIKKTDVKLPMIKVRQNPSKKLEKKYGVKAADLVRNVRKSEDWIHQVKTMKIIAKDVWTKTPEGIEHSKKSIKQRHPDADLSSAIWNLQPQTKGGIEIFFDNSRFRYHDYTIDRDDALRIWDGKKFIAHETYFTHVQEHYAFRKEMPKFNNILVNFMWPRSKQHDYFWRKTKMQDWQNIYGKPEDFIITGTEEFMGKKCYVLESCPKNFNRVRRWFVGIDDGLRYGEIVIEEGEITRHSWTKNYKEVKDGWWFPTEQGYHNLNRDENRKSFIGNTRNIYIEDVEVDKPLSDELFVMEFKDGVEVNDDRFGGFIVYKWKNDRTEQEWQELRNKAANRTKKDDAEKAKIDAWIGKDAIDFPAGSKWVNTEPLTMEKLRGKVVILQFWGSWCGPCHNYMGSLKKADENDKVVVIGVHTPQDDLEVVRKDLAKYKSNGPVCVEAAGESGIKRSGIILGTYEVKRWPYWIVIGPDGKVAGHTGQQHEAFQLARKLTTK